MPFWLSPSLSQTMQNNPKSQMAKPTKIIRKSIYTFLQNYHYFTTTAVLLALPFSASVLLSSSAPSTLLPIVHRRLAALFLAAGFPPNSDFFSILALKLSQTISSSIFSLPFTLTFSLLAKASIIQSLNYHKPNFPPSFSSIISLYTPLFHTYLCNSFLILAANATSLSILFLSFNLIEGFVFSSPDFLVFFLSASGALAYSINLANVLIICNFALVVSGVERSGGYLAILKSCIMIGGKTSTALSLALPVNLALAAIEALFQYRVARAYRFGGALSASIALEGLLIFFLYSIFVVLDTVVGCVFYKSCNEVCRTDHSGENYHRINIAEEKTTSYMILKNSEGLP